MAMVLALLGTLINLPQRVAQAAPPRPDVVLFYLDDNAPYPARLWNDPGLTPNLARFVNHGLRFRNAVAVTPQCGPARAALLTGQYGHNNGVTRNDMRVYDQRGTLSPKLRAKGYKTAFVGKYHNLLRERYPGRKKMRSLADDWNQLDVIWENQGRFYDWRQYRKARNAYYAKEDADHSSFQAARKAVEHIRGTKKGRRLFLVVSLYDGHKPLTPMRRFEGDPRCADIAGWSGPAYDEADVSDKPSWVRQYPRLGAPSYDLTRRCESLLTSDWVVGQVRKALRDTRRIGNTLQILTADNGISLGDHRLKGKLTPYTTSVPLYMRWPKVLKGASRTVLEPVANIDLAPTICRLAGCTMRKADGMSMWPLIKGWKSELDRRFIFTEMLHGDVYYKSSPKGRPPWAGVESTRKYSDTLWVYARYKGGEEELYNISKDPHHLRNLARKPAHKQVLKDMRRFHDQVWKGDDVSFRYKLKPTVPRS
ncbi:MAG: sulfatase-like hydrolase/transferase [Candidatus Limnocylindrales bacterium]